MAETINRSVHAKRIVRVVPKHINGFAVFLSEYGVVGLAVGFVFGAQVKAVVDQLTASFLNPIVGLILPGKGNLDQKTFTLHALGKVAVFSWGSFANTLISFIIIAALIYFVVKFFQLEKLGKKVEEKL
jgi:large conductance mechanosensitive channel